MKYREKLYCTGVLRQQSFSVPVISVGNLMLGGTGKTPTVRHLAKLLLKQGHFPAIISRGHGGKAKSPVNIVSDGQNIMLPVVEAGDEPIMLAESLPGVPVLTGTRRIIPCQHAIDAFNADILILDDGFQHLSVKRDIDIVLFDSTTLAGNSRVFPGGPLREPISALNRCHAFLLTGRADNNLARTAKFSELLQQRYPGRPVFFSSLAEPRLLRPNLSAAKIFEDDKYFGFCGIANPGRFETSLKQLGVQLTGFTSLKDHVAYSQSLLSELCKNAVQSGAEKLITTEKDIVKLQSFDSELPVYLLKIEQQFEPSFDQFILNSLK